jgi:hypothetical protein
MRSAAEAPDVRRNIGVDWYATSCHARRIYLDVGQAGSGAPACRLRSVALKERWLP